MRGWNERILGAAMLLVLFSAIVYGWANRPVDEDGQRFAPSDHSRLAQDYPGGTYVPGHDPRYYRLCKDGYWWRLYPSGRIWWTTMPCWK